MFKIENHCKTPQVVDATDGTPNTRKGRLRTLDKMLTLRTLKRTIKKTQSLKTLKRTLKRTLSLRAFIEDPITEDPKKNPISEHPKKNPITEDPKRTQSNIDTTM